MKKHSTTGQFKMSSINEILPRSHSKLKCFFYNYIFLEWRELFRFCFKAGVQHLKCLFSYTHSLPILMMTSMKHLHINLSAFDSLAKILKCDQWRPFWQAHQQSGNFSKDWFSKRQSNIVTFWHRPLSRVPETLGEQVGPKGRLYRQSGLNSEFYC